MNPRRVVEQYPQSLEAQLLRAGQAVNAPDSTLEVTLTALGLCASSSAAASASGAVNAKAASLFGTLSAKWTAIAILVASGAFVAVHLPRWLGAAASTTGLPQRARAAVTILNIDAPPPEIVTKTLAEPIASSKPDTTAVPRVVPRERLPSTAKLGDSLGAEVALIDAARQALDEGEVARALTLLQQHDRQFKTPRLAQEATLLRARALQQRASGTENHRSDAERN